MENRARWGQQEDRETHTYLRKTMTRVAPSSFPPFRIHTEKRRSLPIFARPWSKTATAYVVVLSRDRWSDTLTAHLQLDTAGCGSGTLTYFNVEYLMDVDSDGKRPLGFYRLRSVNQHLSTQLEKLDDLTCHLCHSMLSVFCE